MSDRLYYSDAYTTTFEAQVIERLIFNDRPAVVLNRSYFYPTSGGQPHDTGQLIDSDHKVNVVDVLIRKEDGAVVHMLDGELEADQVTGQVDWKRRFDHMQHHCGQHVLSRAFIEAVDAPTMSFHMGPEFCTIDIDAQELTPAQILAAEGLANQIVQENRSIIISEVTIDDAKLMPIRKLPPIEDGLVRLVDISDFDLTACGGTHVAHTGEIGLIKVTRLEKRKKMLRVEFLCGNRAIADYGRKTEIMHELTRQLSTGANSLSSSIEKLQQETKSLGREVRYLRKAQMEGIADKLKNGFSRVFDTQLMMYVFTNGESIDDMRQVANILASSKNRIILLGSAGERAMLLFRSSAADKYHMGNLLRSALSHIHSKSGGGQQSLAQGGGQPATAEEVEAALADVKQKIADQLLV
ncbi:MAG: DHHA1 domain-containing protein [Anaerolineae bacterium]